MKAKFNVQFYVIMILGFVVTVGLAIWEYAMQNPKAGSINLIAALMFAMLTFRKYSVDRKMGRAITILNWVILLFIFVAIAAESGFIYK